MAIKGVDPKCYILALFVREDGERFLLGSGRYVFKEKQQHFQANKMANDVIEVQGNDGYLLAGQVRRPGTQDFDGYVGDGTSSKEQVEQWRRDFFKFFRKNYLYKVIYVFSDGSAIQRKRGFLVDAPTVEELYQIYPEYHVALNFEDINYYFYNEDSDGNEIYGKSAIIGLSVGATGGLMWDNLGAISLPYSWLNPVSVSGTDIQINNQLSAEVPITDLQPAGDTYQQTYSGKNNVLVTANGSNLPATLSFKYYTGINYDGAGFEWEAGGSGGDDLITVDSIDDVYPMLTIPGPVVNPTITNVTTGSVFQYTGTLSSTQKLEVDLMAKTALLNGVSVIANVTSSSLYFKSGVNRVSYTTNNADAPDATIKWQEIVG